MTEDSTQASPVRLDIDWVRTIASALAAVSSAVLLSTLGAAGTIIGAALGSVVVTVAGALYSSGLQRSRRGLVRAQSAALQRVGAAQAEVRRAGGRTSHEVADPAVRSDLRHAQRNLARAQQDLIDAGGGPDGPPVSGTVPWRERLAALPWRRVALVAAGLFVVVVVLITLFELLAGRSVASYTGGAHGSGGTSITQLGGGSGDGSPGTPEQTPGNQPGGEPSTGPSGSGEPSPGGTASTEPTPSAPAPSTSPPATSSTSPSPDLSSPATPGGLAPATPTP